MSWSLSVPATPAAEFAAAVDAAQPGTPPPLKPEVEEQVAAAKTAAKAIAESGAIGESGVSFQCWLSGHANEEHEPADGWANDCITVSISQAKEATA